MPDFFGGSGNNGGGPWKNSVDHYYAYTQTSGGGFRGGKGCGTVPSVIIIVILVALVLKSMAAALIVAGVILAGLAICLIFKRQAAANQKKTENREAASAPATEKNAGDNNQNP